MTINRKRSAASDKILGKEKVGSKKPTRKNISSVDILATDIANNPEFGSPSKLVANLLVNTVLETIRQKLLDGEHISLPGIGKIHVIQTNERNGRNPSTGEKLTISSKRKLRFAPYTSIKKDLNSK